MIVLTLPFALLCSIKNGYIWTNTGSDDQRDAQVNVTSAEVRHNNLNLLIKLNLFLQNLTNCLH